MNENRRFPRVSLPYPVRVLCEEAVIEVERGLDVSGGGLALPCHVEIPVGTRCVVGIVLGEDTTIEAQGVVARSENFELGIELTGIGLEAHDLLRALIRFRAQDPTLVDDEVDRRLGLRAD